ncbi:MAG: hypothetical protein HOO88_02605 [Kiritimatiellaceae bacterium]|nr:hypothetical protein [Kiritimatiellaceae bacterium]
MKTSKWCMMSVTLVGLIAVAIMAGQTIRRYKTADGIIIHDAFHGLTGRLIYLKGRFPEFGVRPPAEVWSYDLVTKEKVKLLDVKEAGELFVSADGIWIGIIFENGEILVSSPAKGYTHTFKFPHMFASDEIAAVIINGRLCVKSGPRGGQRVDIIDLQTQRAINVRVAEAAESIYVASRMADTNHLFVSRFSLSSRESGLYMCDLDTGAATRTAGEDSDFFDYSYAGDYVGWDEGAVKVYKVPEGAGKSVDREHGREVCRFYGRDAGLILQQVSPCLRYALVGGSFITGNGMDSIYYLCDLKTGQKKRFVDAKPSKVERGAFIGGVRWVK